MTTRRCLLPIALALSVAHTAQGQGPGMVGPPSASRDFTGERGFLIAKGTTLRGGAGYVYVLGLPLSLGAAYGVTDRLTLNGGTSFWTLADGVPSGYLSARYAVIRHPALGVALGALGVAVTDGDATTTAGWPFVTVTAGADRVAATGLVGVGSSTEVFESDFDGKILLQGLLEAVVTSGLKVLVEGVYLGEGSDPVGALGLRWSGPRVAVEGGVVRVFEPPGASVEVLPWVGVSVRW